MQAMAQGVQAKRAAANPLASLISAMSITSNGKNANASLTIDESLVSSLTSLLDAGMIAPSGK